MKLLVDEPLYSRTEECLQFLRELGRGGDGPVPRSPERYHLYWRGGFGLKQAFAVKSFLATQDLASAELWLWLDAKRGYEGHAENPLLRPLLPFLRVRRFDPKVEARDTLLAKRLELYREVDSRKRSDFFRFVALYKYGGTYVDMDTMFLRDIRVLLDDPYVPDEFCCRWSADRPFGNTAVLRLRQGSDTARALLAASAERGSCDPRVVLRFAENRRLDLTVLPCVFFDPLWPHDDGKERYEAAPFDRFEDFFRRFDDQFRPKPTVRSYRDFFPGAFAYHWHDFWDAPEHEDSYFGLFNRELDGILRERLGIEIAGA